MNHNSYLKKRKPDLKLLLLTVGLSIFGLIAISSASTVVSLTAFDGKNAYYYVLKQLMFIGIGALAMMFFSNIPYQKYRDKASTLLLINIALLVMVFLPVIGIEVKGAHRWINLGFTPFQPSELAKISFIIYLSCWLEKRNMQKLGFISGTLPFVGMLAIMAMLIILEPDLGTLSVIVFSSLAVFFSSGVNITSFISLLGLMAVTFFTFIRMEPYRWNRFMTFMNPSAETLGKGYHINQAFIAISQGGLWGLGFGKSIQKYKYLPEPHTDSIFAIMSEELGFFRAVFIIIAFLYLFSLGLKISKNAPDKFGRYLALGLTASVVFQAFINISAMLGLLPLTGVTLPFISSGGTSVIISFIQIGILLNISRYSNASKY